MFNSGLKLIFSVQSKCNDDYHQSSILEETSDLQFVALPFIKLLSYKVNANLLLPSSNPIYISLMSCNPHFSQEGLK